MVPGSIHPELHRHRGGALGDRRHLRSHRAARRHDGGGTLARAWRTIAPAQTGLLRLTWDNGDRTVLVNPELGGVTLGWHLTHTAQDELFAAIEGTAFHTRVILERMEEHGVPVRRIINGGGIPQKNAVLNQVYANVMGKPVLVPERRRHQPGLGDLRVPGRGRRSDRRRGAGRAVSRAIRSSSPSRRMRLCTNELYALYREAVFRVRQAPVWRGRQWAKCCRSCAGSRLSQRRKECWKHCELKSWKPTSNWCAADW